jgi:hypothetical protein
VTFSRLTRITAVFAAVLALTLSSAVPAMAATETFGAYSRIFERSAGQYWAGTQVGGQWAWSPQSSVESRISWGDPAKWPPIYSEQFILSGDWLMLTGYFDNNTYYKIATTQDWTASGTDCSGTKTTYPLGGGEHYVRWTIPTATGYCVFTEGTITEQLSEKVVHFRHEQLWYPPAPCPANPFITAAAVCIKHTERYSDDKPGSWGVRLLRSGWSARGYGYAWRIENYNMAANPVSPGVATWRADGRYYWSW